MVCRRDAENKLLSFPQDDCKEKMKDEFVFFESNQASNQWCGEVMTNLQKKKKISNHWNKVHESLSGTLTFLNFTSAKPRLVASCWAD